MALTVVVELLTLGSITNIDNPFEQDLTFAHKSKNHFLPLPGPAFLSFFPILCIISPNLQNVLDQVHHIRSPGCLCRYPRRSGYGTSLTPHQILSFLSANHAAKETERLPCPQYI